MRLISFSFGSVFSFFFGAVRKERENEQVQTEVLPKGNKSNRLPRQPKMQSLPRNDMERISVFPNLNGAVRPRNDMLSEYTFDPI